LNAALQPQFEEKQMALTQTQLADAVAEQAGITRNEAKNVLTALEEVILTEIGNAQKVKIGNLVQLTVRLKPATKARQGRNPATGEEITISAKPASVDVRARALAKAKAGLPSLAKAKKVLEG
jgi:DNA-binding protein HU-beta